MFSALVTLLIKNTNAKILSLRFRTFATIVLLSLGLSACATAEYRKFKHSMGYSDDDVTLNGNLVVFSKPSMAKAWLAQFESPEDFLADSDPLARQAQEAVNEIWKKMSVAFPNRAALPPPQVLLQNGTSSDGARLEWEYQRHKRFAHALVVYSNIMSASFPKDERDVLIARCISYLFFHELLDEHPTYYAATEKEPLGFEVENNPKVQDVFQDTEEPIKQVGAFAPEELTGLPFLYSHRDFTLKAVLHTFALTNAAACVSAEDTYKAIRNRLGDRFSTFNQTLVLRPEDKTFFVENRKAFFQDFETCLKDTTLSTTEMMTRTPEAFATPDRYVDATYFSRQPAGDYIHKFVLGGIERRQEMIRGVAKRFPIEKLRAYGYALRSLDISLLYFNANKADPSFLENTMKKHWNSRSLTECEATLKAHKVPNFGGLAGPTTCYEIFHIKQSQRALKKNPHALDGAILVTE